MTPPTTQAPVTRQDFDARCSQLYPNLFRTAANSERASPPPPPGGRAPPEGPQLSGPRTDIASDFDRSGIAYIIASLVLGIPSFLAPLLVSNMFTCEGRHCCRCNGPRGTVAMLCQALGWAAFIYFCGIGSAIEWQGNISCGCSKLVVPAPLLLGGNGTFSTTSTDSSAYNGLGSCQSLDHDMLPRSYLVSHGALSVIATSCAVTYMLIVSAPQRRYTESQRRMAAAPGMGGVGGSTPPAVQLNPLARRSGLAPIITAEPWSPDQGPVCVVGMPVEEGGSPFPVGQPVAPGQVAGMAIGIPVQAARGDSVIGTPAPDVPTRTG